ncbi:MAG: hypothetical protein AAFX99_32355, partial [Myxococcota bacterium]
MMRRSMRGLTTARCSVPMSSIAYKHIEQYTKQYTLCSTTHDNTRPWVVTHHHRAFNLGPPMSSDDLLTIATYNVHGWSTADGTDNIDAVGAFLHGQALDVVGLQEVDGAEGLAAVGRRTGLTHGQNTRSCALLSRHRIVDQGLIIGANTPHRGFSRRRAIHATLEVGGRRLRSLPTVALTDGDNVAPGRGIVILS